MQAAIQLLFLLADIVGNMYLLTHADYATLIVVFNAAMIMIVYIVDFVIVKLQKYWIDIKIGEHFTQKKEW